MSPKPMSQQPTVNLRRLNIFLLILYLFVAVLISRLFFLQIIKHDFYKSKAESQLERIIRLYPNRGEILDRNLTPLAITKPCYSAYIIPSQIRDKRRFINVVAPILGMRWQDAQKRVYNRAPFVWLKRQLDDSVYARLSRMNLAGLHFVQDERRIYPQGELGADVLGFVGIDNQGLGGIEHKFDYHLKGEEARIVLQGDPQGNRLVTEAPSRTIFPFERRPQNSGGSVVLTIDSFIQFSAQKHLRNGVDENGALKGQVLVMSPKTGEILAMADYPAYDPNNWVDYDSFIRRNSCVTDVYEPGSIFKIITLASVLEENLVSPDTVMMVPETYSIAGHNISEAHDRKEGETDRRTVSEIIEESLNVGTTMLALKLGEEKFYRYIKSFGFGQRLDLDLPAESAGLFREVEKWSGLDIAMLSFGQGIAVTTLQMATAVAAVANDGLMLKPRIVKEVNDNRHFTVKGMPKMTLRRVISEETALKIQDIMVRTVNEGTGAPARIPGYDIAGKTGTAQKAKKDGRGYERGKYVASFLGFFPAYDPEVLIVVMVDSPKKSIYGSSVAAPIFRNIAWDIIDYMSIPPDKPVEYDSALSKF